MNCSDIVARFTDYLDGSLGERETATVREHLDECSSCRRYRNVLEHGAALLRSLPEPELREDFRPRLQHRLYHVDDEKALSAHATSGAPALTVVGIALLLTAVAWAPTLQPGAPLVELDPIVVDRAPRRASLLPVISTPLGTFSSKTPADLDGGLWENALLYDYSPLSQRYLRSMRVRRASEPDR
jgi:anti-sigma factor RsiW